MTVICPNKECKHHNKECKHGKSHEPSSDFYGEYCNVNWFCRVGGCLCVPILKDDDIEELNRILDI